MFWLVALLFWLMQLFIALFRFSRSSATKCVPLNNEPYMTRPTLIAVNLVEPNN